VNQFPKTGRAVGGLSLSEEHALNVQGELEARQEVIEVANCAWGALEDSYLRMEHSHPEDAEALKNLSEALDLWARCVNNLNPQGGYPELVKE